MLYATTRSEHDTYTAQRALKEACALDGGLFVPMKLPVLPPEQIDSLQHESEHGILALVLNLFFNCRLTHADVEFAIGKRFLKLKSIHHRVIVGECWHNPEGDIARLERILAGLIAVDKTQIAVGNWLSVAVRTAILFVLYGRMRREGLLDADACFDAAVSGDCFDAPMAAWYAAKMGLPIGRIVCCGNNNGIAWDLLQLGQMKLRKDQLMPAGLERLIRECLGSGEAVRFAQVANCGGVYDLTPEQLEKLREKMHICVVSEQRIPRVISNSYVTNGYLLEPQSAAIYGGLMDFRASSGNNGTALILSEKSPALSEDSVAKAMGITVQEMRKRLQRRI